MAIHRYKTREEWLDDRSKGIGASEAAAIMGANPWKGPYAVYQEKVGEAPPVEQTDKMLAGTVLEPAILELYKAKYPGWEIEPNELDVYSHHKHEWLRATPDAWAEHAIMGEGLIEVKNTTSFNAADWVDGAPLMYQIQAAHQLAVCRQQDEARLLNPRFVRLVCLIDGWDLRTFDVPHDPEFETLLITKEAAFWERVQKRRPPEPDETDATTDLINDKYPRGEAETEVEVPENLITQLVMATEIGKDHDKDMKRLKNELREAMGNATYATVNGARVYQWKQVKKNIKAKEAYVSEYPELRMLKGAKGLALLT